MVKKKLNYILYIQLVGSTVYVPIRYLFISGDVYLTKFILFYNVIYPSMTFVNNDFCCHWRLLTIKFVETDTC